MWPFKNKKQTKKEDLETETNENLSYIMIYPDGADVKGFIPAKDMATMMIMLHGGDYASILINSIKIMANKNLAADEAKKYYEEFAAEYEKFFMKAVSSKIKHTPVVKPTEAFKGLQ